LERGPSADPIGVADDVPRVGEHAIWEDEHGNADPTLDASGTTAEAERKLAQEGGVLPIMEVDAVMLERPPSPLTPG